MSPFEELANFYKKFGFTEFDTIQDVVHSIILKNIIDV
ncbi:hypothetical protein B4082_0647 [Bacillus cereus]|uniref:Uncharacterized protein n=1 Tax=Bacillus cereus TaxID=1396 RepID=A0A161TF75_BACCE|nr:hypothetical protein B4082_0647 [Bacillus cereus]